jgi:hypothetical protein
MNEKELREALLTWAAKTSSTAEPEQTVARVLARDRRRVRMLAAATAILWVIAAGGIPLFFAMFMNFIFPKIEHVLREMITHRDNLEPARLAEAAHTVLLAASKLSILLVSGSVIALLLAACGTLMLVFALRRATLRQVNANLAEIAEQIRSGGGK